jgi:hypothetical protein
MSGIRGIKTVSPSPFPVKIVASITLPSIFFTHSLVPLQSFGGSRFSSKIIGDPTLSKRRCGGNPAELSEFRNSGGKLTTSSAFTTVSIGIDRLVFSDNVW